MVLSILFRWSLLASAVAEEFRKLLKMEPTTPAFSSTAGATPLDANYAAPVMCPDKQTGCPAGTTCIADAFSNTKWGCCMMPQASGCHDDWHCCSSGMACRGNGTNPVSPGHPTAANYSHVCVASESV